MCNPAQLVHDGSFLLMALITLGGAAHITALCDSTVRAVSGGYSAQLTGVLSVLPADARGGRGGAHRREHVPADVSAEAQLLTECIINSSERGGFRIVGQRVTFGWRAPGSSPCPCVRGLRFCFPPLCRFGLFLSFTIAILNSNFGLIKNTAVSPSHP